MSIVGEKPESGMRITLERPRDENPPWIYVGAIETPDLRRAIRVVVSASGDVDVAADSASSPSDSAASSDSVPPLSADLAERVRLLVRTAYRQAKSDGQPPARRIVRWRPAGDPA